MTIDSNGRGARATGIAERWCTGGLVPGQLRLGGWTPAVWTWDNQSILICALCISHARRERQAALFLTYFFFERERHKNYPSNILDEKNKHCTNTGTKAGATTKNN